MPSYDLPRTSPEQQGVASSRILEFVHALENQIHEIHSLMLLRHGNVIAEGWWSPYGRDYPHKLFSLSKSFTSTAVGLAVNEGYFSIDDSVLSFFPDESPAEVNEHLAAMRVRHLLTMTTGHVVDTWANMFDRSNDCWIKGFFEVPVTHAPGTHFLYNTGATYMLAAIVQKTTGMKLLDYLQPRLFEPLGIENLTWDESPQGIVMGGIGLNLKTEDIARFGQLYLQKGMWQGKQILPESWVTEATSFQVANGDYALSDWAQGYGYQFWRCRHGAYRGDGAFGQYCIVMPEQDAVLAMTGGVDALEMQPPLDLVWQILLPAMCPDALPYDSAAHEKLITKLSALAFQPMQGQPTSPVASQISGRAYKVDVNALDLESITLNFTEAGCAVTLKTSTDEDTILSGYGVWQRGQTTLLKEPHVFTPTQIAVSGAWTADSTFTMVIRLYETPFYSTLICHFLSDELMIETRINASLESTKPLLLTARAV
jgi:CubicO group peptidase (beta-lactamase class C family)